MSPLELPLPEMELPSATSTIGSEKNMKLIIFYVWRQGRIQKSDWGGRDIAKSVGHRFIDEQAATF